jgi:membrane-bound lytic murein transglycosylase D
MNNKLIQAVLVSCAFVTGVANYALIGIQATPSVAPATSPAVRREIAAEVGSATQIPKQPVEFPEVDNSRVDYWVKRLTTSERRSFAIFLDRADKYAPMITSKLAERDMPEDLLYLAMIESGFNPNAKSPAKAAGMWQFVAATAQRYGLKVGRHVDERTDPEKSTDAALAYLSDLYDQFGSWYLAAAAYNSGEGRVARAMKKANESDFFEVAKFLPKETADYVPKLIAAARIAKQPEKYGFEPSNNGV